MCRQNGIPPKTRPTPLTNPNLVWWCHRDNGSRRKWRSCDVWQGRTKPTGCRWRQRREIPLAGISGGEIRTQIRQGDCHTSRLYFARYWPTWLSFLDRTLGRLETRNKYLAITIDMKSVAGGIAINNTFTHTHTQTHHQQITVGIPTKQLFFLENRTGKQTCKQEKSILWKFLPVVK